MKLRKSYLASLGFVLLSAINFHIGYAQGTVPSGTNPGVHHHATQNLSGPPNIWNPLLVGIRTKLTYETIQNTQETLYVFKPVNHLYPLSPVVVYVHGGFLMYGNAIIGFDTNQYNPHDEMISRIEAGLVSHGFTFVSINYRLAPAFKWPIQLEDAKAAIRFLRAHASDLGINPERIGVMGDSAGGGLANFIGLTGQEVKFNNGIWPNESSSVSAVVDMFGPSNRRPFALHWLKMHGTLPNPVFGYYTPTTIISESAVDYVKPGDPPFLILQGLQDTVEPPYQSYDLYNRLRAAGNSAQLILIHHSQHEFHAVGGPISPSINTMSDEVVTFFFRHLG